jgi:hypothetical protein
MYISDYFVTFDQKTLGIKSFAVNNEADQSLR